MRKNKKLLGFMKDELGRQIMRRFVGLRPRTYASLKSNDDKSKNTKDTKRCVIERNIAFKDFKNFLKTC